MDATAPPALEKALPTPFRRPKFRLEEMSKAEGYKCIAIYFVIMCVMLGLWLVTHENMYNEWQQLTLADGCWVDPYEDAGAWGGGARGAAALQDGGGANDGAGINTPAGAGGARVDMSPVRQFSSMYRKCTTALTLFTIARDTLPITFKFVVNETDASVDSTYKNVKFSHISVGSREATPAEFEANLVCKSGACELDQDLIYETWNDPELIRRVQFEITEASKRSLSQLDGAAVYARSTNPDFELKELLTRYILLIIATGVAARFYYRIAFSNLLYPWHAWALEQKWTFILLVLLIGFDNPFIVTKVYARVETKAFWMFIDIGLRYTFLLGYMLAVWSMTDHIAQSLLQTPRKTPKQFYGPKLALLVPLWVIVVLHVCTRDRPQMAITNPWIVAFATIVVVIYAISLLFLIFVMVHKVTSTERTENQQVNTRFQVLWTINILMIIACAVCIYRTNSFGLQGWEFVVTYVGFNLYVFILATLFTPAISSMPYRPMRGPVTQDAEAQQQAQEVVINDEYEDDGDY